MIQTTSLETRTGKSIRDTDNPTKKFSQSDANVTNNSGKMFRIPNELRQQFSTNCHFSEIKSAIHEDMQLY